MWKRKKEVIGGGKKNLIGPNLARSNEWNGERNPWLDEVLLFILNIRTNYLMNPPSDYDSGFTFPHLLQPVDINLTLDWITSLYASLVYKQFFHIPFSFRKCAIIVFNNLLSLFVQCTFGNFLLPLFITHSLKHVKFVSDCFYLLPQC